MKFTKFIPVALALMLATPAFAVSSVDSASSIVSLTLDDFIYITSNGDQTATASFDASYDNITLDKNVLVQFGVVTNKDIDYVKVSAKTFDSSTNALYVTSATNQKLVFTKTGSTAASADTVQNAGTAAAAIASNPDTIAFGVGAVATADAGYGGSITTTTPGTNDIIYTLTNGKYTFKYTMDKNAVAKTFSTHDTSGTYTATVTMEQCTAP